MSSEDLSPENLSSSALPVTYSVNHDLDHNADVRIVFHGLLWFTYHGTDECLIGIHNTTQGHLLEHKHPHELNLTCWKTTRSGTKRECEPIHIGNPKTIEGIQIDVNNPKDDRRGVYVYEKGDFNRPEDPNHLNDPNDWRWALDFEDRLFYPTGIKLKPKTVSSVISINHGLFYTLQKTTSTFELLRGSGDPVEIGNVAQYLAGNIYLKPDGEVKLTVRYPFPRQPEIMTLPWIDGTRYQIDISNDCQKHNEPCRFQRPDHPTDKKQRNDFYLYYDCFHVPSGAHEIGLKLKQHNDPPPLPDYFYTEEKSPEHHTANNDSPCGAVVASRGGYR